nr:hypothetical protein BaRGS_021731 [Batillaria attramentaria]
MNSTLRAVRKIEADKKRVEELPEAEHASVSSVQVDTKSATKKDKTEAKPTPAYERYEYLAKEGTPTLALPGKFQRLLTMFQGSDTVVSMLYNRQETITFSKLQTAVQSMTRKNFEQGTLGQIKKVYPTAYTLRQEKNLPCFGNKTSGYQLTVEPNLVDCGADADVEAHLKLLQELAPKWIQVVQITRGKFVKIDKNADIAVLIDKITKLAKSGK